MGAYEKKKRCSFSGVYICGHEGTESAYTRDYAEAFFVAHKCPKCSKVDWLKAQQKINEENSKKSNELNLISLTGTEKQVAWANTIRINFLNKIEESINELKQSDDPICKDPYYYFFNKFISDHQEKYPFSFSDYVNVDSYFRLLADVKNKVLSKEKANYFINFKEYDRDIEWLIKLFESEYSDKVGHAELDLTKFMLNKNK